MKVGTKVGSSVDKDWLADSVEADAVADVAVDVEDSGVVAADGEAVGAEDSVEADAEVDVVVDAAAWALGVREDLDVEVASFQPVHRHYSIQNLCR